MKRSGTIVARPNPIPVSGSSGLGVTTLKWTAPGADLVEVRVGSPRGPLLSRSGPSGYARTGEWVQDGTVFYLQDASGDSSDPAAMTLAAVTVRLRPTPRERVRRYVQRFRDRFVSRGLILLYHRIADTRSDPWALSVAPARFAEHLEVLQKCSPVIALHRITESARDRTLPSQWVAITFDDGYADNLSNAKPLLERHGMPATVFLASGFVGTDRAFWSAALAKAVLEPHTLPSDLRFVIRGTTHEWTLGDARFSTAEESNAQAHRRGWDPIAPTARYALLQALYALLLPLPHEERRSVMNDLTAWAGVDAAADQGSQWLSADEVRALTHGGLIQAGAHTVSHSFLASLPETVQREEIQQSKRQIEDITGHPVFGFAYPYGKPDSYTAATVGIVRDAGFACACSNWPGVVRRGTDCFELPRLHVHDWDGEQFEERLSRWWAGQW